MADTIALASSNTFRRDVEEIRGRIEKSVESNRTSFAAGLGDMVETLTAEIERLNAVIADRAAVPDRRIVQLAAVVTPAQHYQVVNLLALDDAGVAWCRDIAKGVDAGTWKKVPGLPSATEELEELRKSDEHRKLTAQAREAQV
jgi:hypothetical protein